MLTRRAALLRRWSELERVVQEGRHAVDGLGSLYPLETLECEWDLVDALNSDDAQLLVQRWIWSHAPSLLFRLSDSEESDFLTSFLETARRSFWAKRRPDFGSCDAGRVDE